MSKKQELANKIKEMKDKMSSVDHDDVPQYEKFLTRLEQEFHDMPNDIILPETDTVSENCELEKENELLIKRLEYMRSIP